MTNVRMTYQDLQQKLPGQPDYSHSTLVACHSVDVARCIECMIEALRRVGLL